jgi:uncharacterized SAM-binding protein YcdF (DUF218 family)
MVRTDSGRFWETTTGIGLGAALGLLAEGLDLPALVSWWGDRTWLVLASVALGGVLGASRLRRVLPAAVLPLVLVWAVIAFTPLTRWLAAGLVRSEAPVRADAVFPLASSLQDDGGLTVASLPRLLRALELVAQGHTRRVILSELQEPNPAAAPAVRELMAALGIEAELIVVGPVGSTRDEVVAVAALVRERGFGRLLLVSSPAHTLRASLSFEAEGVPVTPVAALEVRYDIERLDRPGDRVQAFGPLMHERLGLAWYRWRGWIR